MAGGGAAGGEGVGSGGIREGEENLPESGDTVSGMGKGTGYGEGQWAIFSVLDVNGPGLMLGAQEAILGKVGELREV